MRICGRTAIPAIRGPAHRRESWRRSCRTSYRKTHLVESTSLSMDLNTINAVERPRTREQLPVWTAGDAWLAGGTWLFSEPQAHLKRLIDLNDLNWPALTIGEAVELRHRAGRRDRQPGLADGQ